jgi:uncharacterized membrane protein SpoIIM required for sporulation
VIGSAVPLLLTAAAGILIGLYAREKRRQRRREAHAAEHAARPLIDCADGVVAVALAAACCETWWPTAGTGHDDTCPRAKERTR